MRDVCSALVNGLFELRKRRCHSLPRLAPLRNDQVIRAPTPNLRLKKHQDFISARRTPDGTFPGGKTKNAVRLAASPACWRPRACSQSHGGSTRGRSSPSGDRQEFGGDVGDRAVIGVNAHQRNHGRQTSTRAECAMKSEAMPKRIGSEGKLQCCHEAGSRFAT